MELERSALSGSGHSWDTALGLARACQLTYGRDLESVRRVIVERWGFDDCVPFNVENVEGYVAWDTDAVVVAFRGTTSIGDWLTNLDLLSTNRTYGAVHSGFHEAYTAVRDPIVAALQDADAHNKFVWLTGHSLGGALATVALAELHEELSEAGLCTFGQPRTVDDQAAHYIRNQVHAPVVRYVNDEDLVARVPPGYVHVGTEIRFDADGEPEEREWVLEALSLPADSQAMDIEEFWQLQEELREIRQIVSEKAENVAIPGSMLDTSIEGFIPGIADHRISEYVRLVQIQSRRLARAEARIDALLEKSVQRPFLLPPDVAIAPETAMKNGDEDQGTIARTGNTRAGGTMGPQSIPVLLKVRDPQWQAPEGIQVQSRLGTVISASISAEQVRLLQLDDEVLSIDSSRKGGVFELAQSKAFLRADQIATPPIDERGDAALIGIIDSGIDVLHEAFLDAGGNTRIRYIWDQRTETADASPHVRNAAFTQTYGTLYDQADIQAMVVQAGPVPPNLRDPRVHGTHVASIAAGRAVGPFSGGIAPEAGLIVVIPSFDTSAGSPVSLGYSVSHVDALAFVQAAAQELELPVAVNVSLGMNAGAHDGSSMLEAAFDSFTDQGRDPGIVLVKSAGNERGHGGHARADVAVGMVTDITWESDAVPRADDYFEFWFHAFDDIEFTLEAPSGNVSATVSSLQPTDTVDLGGNTCRLILTQNHNDNGDNLLTLVIEADTQPIQVGTWKLRMHGLGTMGDGVVHGWVERDRARAVTFHTGDNDEMTLSIPGTAKHVITVAACGSQLPLQLTQSSSYGLTRDDRPKPDISAPGNGIVAALAAQADHQAVTGMTGTSMAAPHVTGSIALVLSKLHKDPAKAQVNANQITTGLIKSAKNFTGQHNKGAGYGVLDTLDFFNRF